jgi:hypothetical protein
LHGLQAFPTGIRYHANHRACEETNIRAGLRDESPHKRLIRCARDTDSGAHPGGGSRDVQRKMNAAQEDVIFSRADPVWSS